MVALRKRKFQQRSYYYLEHSYRSNGRVMKEEKYLGKTIPKNLKKKEKMLWEQIYQRRWLNDFDRLKSRYSKAQRKIAPSAKQKAMDTFAIRYTYNSNKIEGSTLTLKETALLIQDRITPSSRPLSQVLEAEAHIKTFEKMLLEKKDVTMELILRYHRELFLSTKEDIAGRLRAQQVAIAASRFTPPLAIEVYPLMMDLIKWYRRSKAKMHPVHLAGLLHLKLVTIHPFVDGNGRISRLLMNMVLWKNGFPMLDIPYKDRSSYYSALERSQVKDDDSIFLQWFFKRYHRTHIKTK